MEKKFANLEKNMATNTTMQNNMAILETKLAESVEKNEQNMAKNTAYMEGKLEAVNNEVKGLENSFG